jgi:hypothetical protein
MYLLPGILALEELHMPALHMLQVKTVSTGSEGLANPGIKRVVE